MRQPHRLDTLLDRLGALVDESQPGPVVGPATRSAARRRALQLFDALGGGESAQSVVAVAYAAELFGAVAVDLAARPADASRVIAGFEEATGVGRVALAREALRWPGLTNLPADVALEVQLSLLVSFSDAEAVSLWTQAREGQLSQIALAGQAERDSPNAHAVADALIGDAARGGQPTAVRSSVGIRIADGEGGAAALVAHSMPRGDDHRLLVLQAGAPGLAAVLRRIPASGSRATLTSVERRLARLRYDLHDGPQQDVHLLAADLALFREQLLPIVRRDPNLERIVGRLDDLAAQLVALDGDLRRLSSAVQSPFLPGGTLPEALRELTEAFALRTGIQPQTTLQGDFSGLSESQQITVLALIREALSNVREHADAHAVTIAVTSDDHGVQAQIVDDGGGFEPERTLVQAARDGHLGLVGMHERVRMLGGRTQIESRPGGPTVISASLPAWRPEEPAV
ncbi:MAG: sensor histidine kinase [Solirubrobacteraceae bacterium]